MGTDEADTAELGMIGLTLAYVLAVEIAKKQFYARVAHVNQ